MTSQNVADRFLPPPRPDTLDVSFPLPPSQTAAGTLPAEPGLSTPPRYKKTVSPSPAGLVSPSTEATLRGRSLNREERVNLRSGSLSRPPLDEFARMDYYGKCAELDRDIWDLKLALFDAMGRRIPSYDYVFPPVRADLEAEAVGETGARPAPAEEDKENVAAGSNLRKPGEGVEGTESQLEDKGNGELVATVENEEQRQKRLKLEQEQKKERDEEWKKRLNERAAKARENAAKVAAEKEVRVIPAPERKSKKEYRIIGRPASAMAKDRKMAALKRKFGPREMMALGRKFDHHCWIKHGLFCGMYGPTKS